MAVLETDIGGRVWLDRIGCSSNKTIKCLGRCSDMIKGGFQKNCVQMFGKYGTFTLFKRWLVKFSPMTHSQNVIFIKMVVVYLLIYFIFRRSF